MTAPSPDAPQGIPVADLAAFFDLQTTQLEMHPGVAPDVLRNQKFVYELVGRHVGQLAAGGETVTADQISEYFGPEGPLAKNVKGRLLGDQVTRLAATSQDLIVTARHPDALLYPVLHEAEAQKKAERLEAERPALIEEALKAAGYSPQIHLVDERNSAEFGPNQGSKSHRYEPWSMFKTFSGQHHLTGVGEAVAFTPARTSRLEQHEAGRRLGKMQYRTETIHEQARVNGEPAVDIHYLFDPDFNGSHQVPGYGTRSASYRITVPQSMAERLRESGPAAFRGIMDRLVMEWGNNGRAAEFREAWNDAPGSVRPPYSSLNEHWQMTVFDAMDKPVDQVVTALGQHGDRAGIQNVYTLSRIPAGPNQAPPSLPKAA